MWESMKQHRTALKLSGSHYEHPLHYREYADSAGDLAAFIQNIHFSGQMADKSRSQFPLKTVGYVMFLGTDFRLFELSGFVWRQQGFNELYSFDLSFRDV